MNRRCFKSLAINIGMAFMRVRILIYQACCATSLFPYIPNSVTVYVFIVFPTWSKAILVTRDKYKLT